MIKCYLNGKNSMVDSSLSLAEALKQWDYKEGTVAVAVNEVFIPRSQYQAITITENDRIEIVAAMQGG